MKTQFTASLPKNLKRIIAIGVAVNFFLGALVCLEIGVYVFMTHRAMTKLAALPPAVPVSDQEIDIEILNDHSVSIDDTPTQLESVSKALEAKLRSLPKGVMVTLIFPPSANPSTIRAVMDVCAHLGIVHVTLTESQ